MSQGSKDELRKIYLEKRRDLSAHERDLMSAKVVEGFKDLTSNLNSSMVHTFIPIQKFNEIDTWQLISYLQSREGTWKVVVPRMNSDKETLSNYYFNPDKLEKNSWGILEPAEDSQPVPDSELDIVIVPLLAFDLKGARVGYGKAFYDRFLGNCRGDVLKVGLSYFPPEQQIDTDPWDVLLDACITPDEIFKFS